MANSPSQRWENGVLAERAISTFSPADPVESDEEPQATKPYKTPTPTKTGAKAVMSAGAENKSVPQKRTAKK